MFWMKLYLAAISAAASPTIYSSRIDAALLPSSFSLEAP